MNAETNSSVDKPRRVSSLHRRSRRQRTVHCELVVIPVRLDRSPGELYWTDHFSVNRARTSLQLMVERDDPFPGKELVVGASIEGRPHQFANLSIHSQRSEDGLLRIVGRWMDDPIEDLLSECNLSPRVDATQFRFQYGCSEDVLRKWESLGVLRRYFVDRILVCPKCQSIPTWRDACPRCRSARYSRDRLIHHFACAHVDRAAKFQTESETLQCPKCLAQHLISGTDFEYIHGPLNCFDCGKAGMEPILSGMCHQCFARFGTEDAIHLDLYGYHVDRLDLLDFVAAPQ